MKARVLAHICLTAVHSFFIPVGHCLLQRMNGVAEGQIQQRGQAEKASEDTNKAPPENKVAPVLGTIALPLGIASSLSTSVVSLSSK